VDFLLLHCFLLLYVVIKGSFVSQTLILMPYGSVLFLFQHLSGWLDWTALYLLKSSLDCLEAPRVLWFAGLNCFFFVRPQSGDVGKQLPAINSVASNVYHHVPSREHTN
jgi:hypothetical protein